VFDELHRPFDENELDLCITKLKRDKAIGIENIMNEYILMSKNLIKPVLCKLSNNILNTGNFPEIWVRSIIIPIFKKRNPNINVYPFLVILILTNED
jgi:hypothetical protein